MRPSAIGEQNAMHPVYLRARCGYGGAACAASGQHGARPERRRPNAKRADGKNCVERAVGVAVRSRLAASSIACKHAATVHG